MNLISFLLICFLCYPLAGFAKITYYLDNTHGDDNNSGKTEKTAWKSLQMINSATFKGGDCIFLKRGQKYDGSLHLKGSGANSTPVKLSAYGVGRRPVINAAGNESAIKLMDADHWEISDIETTGGEKTGIFIGCTQNDLVMDHIIISNCYVHDIGDTSKPDWKYSTTTGGIIVVNGTFDNAGQPVFYNSIFNDVIINDCTVRYNLRWTCISISSGKMNGTRGNDNFIKNCIAEYSAADGIRMNGVQNSRIEYCVMYKNGAWPKTTGKNLGGLGAWFFDAENCTIQYCEASYVGANSTDGGAFDIDYWQKNSTVQYCYGHHCAGYGVSVFGADPDFPTENSVVRYNIFAHNGRDSAFAFQGDFFVFTWQKGLLNGVNIHDNISYWNPASNAPTLKFDADFTGENPNAFTRNTIYSDQPWLVYCKNDSLKCDSNLYLYNHARHREGDMKPIWDEGRNHYHSLEEWQNGTGQDAHSILGDHEIPDSSFIGGEIIPQKADLEEYTGNLVVISFICKYNSGKANESDSMLAQLAYIKSMKSQYEEKGLKVLVMLESGFALSGTEKDNTLVNFINDHELAEILLNRNVCKTDLGEKSNEVVIPTTFLISRDGYVIRKWNNLVLPAQLAFAIEAELR